MLPSRIRGRYFIFIVLSLLVHVTTVAVMLWKESTKDENNKSSTTVTIQLKEKTEPKKEEPKKAEAKKAEAKKAEAKKAEAKKAEAKKAEAKKAEAKKAEAKKAEAKKAEAKKAEAKKAEAKKAEAKKAEVKKAEAKKAEAKKAEAKKAEAKKAEAKKAEAKKAEAKKAEAKKAEATKADVQFNPYQSSLDLLNQGQSKNSESLRKQQALPKFGSMTMLDDRELKESVVYTKGYGNRFKKREVAGQRIKKSLSRYEKQKLNEHLLSQANYIFSFFNAPKKDGKSYYGEISILLNSDGKIAYVTMKTPSGSKLLDDAVYKTIMMAKQLRLPADPMIRKAMVTSPLTLNYSEEEMAD